MLWTGLSPRAFGEVLPPGRCTVMSFEMEACAGRFLLPDCKRKSNYEGLGSSLTFHRATVAYALLFNLTITSEPCARAQTSPFP